MAEIDASRTGFEYKRNFDETVVNPIDIDLPNASATCTFSVSDTNITCDFLNPPSQIVGKKIQLDRGASVGSWVCSSDVPAQFLPKGCVAI